jgi:hypothetical protein
VAGSGSIAAELLKNGGRNFLDALHEVIQLAWIGETIPESWNKGVLCPVYKKVYKKDSYRGICLLNVAYSMPTRSFNKPTTDQLFALRQIKEKGYEYQNTTHHLFIDFKAEKKST